MGTGHLTKAQIEAQQKFGAEVKELLDRGMTRDEIAILLGCHKNKITFAIHRLKNGGVSMNRAPHDAGKEAEEEAEMLINAKLAPINKPKPKLTRVDGWENGKYVHYTAWDYSEFWGL